MDKLSFLNNLVKTVKAAPPPYSKSSAEPLQLSDFNILYARIVEVIMGIAGLVLFLMLIVGGIKYITAGGEPEALASARKTLTFAIAGIVLIASAFLIMVIIQTITGVPVTVFNIYTP